MGYKLDQNALAALAGVFQAPEGPVNNDRSAIYAAQQDALARRYAAGAVTPVGSSVDQLGDTAPDGPRRRATARQLLG